MRFAISFVRESSNFESDVKLIIDEREYEGKSLLGVMSVIAVEGEEITIVVDGNDEETAVKELSTILEAK